MGSPKTHVTPTSPTTINPPFMNLLHSCFQTLPFSSPLSTTPLPMTDKTWSLIWPNLPVCSRYIWSVSYSASISSMASCLTDFVIWTSFSGAMMCGCETDKNILCNHVPPQYRYSKFFYDSSHAGVFWSFTSRISKSIWVKSRILIEIKMDRCELIFCYHHSVFSRSPTFVDL